MLEIFSTQLGDMTWVLLPAYLPFAPPMPDAPPDAGYVEYYGLGLAIAGAVAIAWLGYYTWLNKDDFRITVRGHGVYFRGRFPALYRAQVADFLRDEVAPPGTLRVIGNWTPNRVLRIAVQGKISTGEQQRIRNFMKMTLKG